jgi:tetratricopeptide (TPR) repeat protein
MTTRLLSVGVEAGILGILLLSPIPFGSVLPWAQAGLEAIVALTVGMWVIRMLAAGHLGLRANPLLWPGVAMLGLIGAQVLLPGRSVNAYATWESFRLFVAYLAFLVVLGAHLVTPGRIVRLVSVLVAWGVALASWGLLNRALGGQLVHWGERDGYHGRLVSTFVNPNHQALYFVIPLFLAVGMLLRPARRSRAPVPAGAVTMSLRGTGAVARILFGAAALVLGVALVLTASRGGVAAAIAGVLAVGVLALVGRVRSGILIGFVASLAAFTGYIAWLGADVLVDRLAVLAREPFADLRWEIWRSTLRIAADAPMLGAGLGTFEDAIIAHRPAILSDPRFVDHAHNDYLQLLAEGGIVAVLILVWAAAAWLTFVIARWRDRQDAFVRGLVLGGLGAVVAVACQSGVDFGLHMPANALLLVAVLALLPAVVTLRAHRAGLKVDLPEWRGRLGLRRRIALGAATAVLVAVSVVALVPVALADWKYREVSRVVSRTRLMDATLTTADFARAERELRTAARLDPWNPRIQTAWADAAAELGHRTWTFALASDGTRVRADSPRDRLAASQGHLGAAYAAYGRSLRSQPLVSLTHGRFGWFLARLDVVRRTVEAEGLRGAVTPSLADTLGSDESLVPRALEHLREAGRLDPTNPQRHLSLVAFVVSHYAEIPTARAITIDEAREAIRLKPQVLPEVVELLTVQTISPDLLWHAVPREASVLMDLASILEDRGRASAAAAALEDAVAMASTPTERVSTLLARSRFLLRQRNSVLALSQVRQAMALAPQNPEVFAVLAEVYQADGQLDAATSALSSALAVGADLDVRTLNGYRARLAAILAQRGDLAGALVLRRRVAQDMPNEAMPHLDLAEVLDARQELAEALREYETARRLGQNDWWVQRTVTHAFLRHGLLREAASAAEQTIRLKPGDDDLRVELGDLYSRMGLADRAKEHYRTVLTRQPAHKGASQGLRAVSGLQGHEAGGG